MILTQDGKFERAKISFTDSIRLDPKSVYGFVGRAYLHSEVLADYKPAIEDLTSAIHLQSENPLLYYNRGRVYYCMGQHRKAIEDYDRCIELNHEIVQAYVNRGQALMELKESTGAMNDFDHALELDPTCVSAYVHRGQVYSNFGRHREAIRDLDEAIQLDSKHVDAHLFRGIAHTETGEVEKAKRDLNKALELHPESAAAYTARGLLYQRTNLYEKALSDLRKALEIDKNYPKALKEISWLLSTCKEPKMRDGKRAKEYAKSACEATKWVDINSIECLAAACAELGEFAEAVRLQERAVESIAPDEKGRIERAQKRALRYKDRRKAAEE